MTENRAKPTVVLGVCSSISAYKACDIIRGFQKREVNVRVVMTRNAARLVSPQLLAALSGNEVPSDLWSEIGSPRILHIELAKAADLLLAAPATANMLAKFAVGVADDLLSSLYLAVTCPVAAAPAMNVNMYQHARTQANLSLLRDSGVTIIEPEAGYLACGDEGPGRLAPPGTIVDAALALLGRDGALKGRRVLVTAGPTREFLDPLRFLTSRSSGKMGYALAGEALRRGARVTLISGPSPLTPPSGAELVRVDTADQMNSAVRQALPEAGIVIMAAAVSDYAFERTAAQKIKKGDGSLAVRLTATPDILQDIGRDKGKRFLVGFAAETENLENNARAKAERKDLDMIVANDVSRPGIGFDSDQNQVTIIDRDGRVRRTEIAPKTEISRMIWDEIEARLGEA